ncbi:hypothetical protein FA95DRAFT_1402970 [Auriscalpium vulgare]|uniref:Uncharacterized protein n=1 Tax=Auriscalpium vulgare TaxID=40419 RepID=A0ACB8RQI7_9AGAM|nr:hypothetical protein FA95DRAFT_1402970 [Auriscalpium vulgare]
MLIAVSSVRDLELKLSAWETEDEGADEWRVRCASARARCSIEYDKPEYDTTIPKDNFCGHVWALLRSLGCSGGFPTNHDVPTIPVLQYSEESATMQKDMRDLLRVRPSKVMEAARSGSVIAMQALCYDPHGLPDHYKPEAVTILCAFIRKTPMPIGTGGAGRLIQRCFFGLQSLFTVPYLLHIPDVMDTWPIIIKWFHHFTQQLADGQGYSDNQSTLQSNMLIVHLLAQDSEIYSRILAIPDTINVVTAMWMATDVNVVPAYPGAALAFAQLLNHAPTPVIRLLTSVDVDVNNVATHVVFPLSVALTAHPIPDDIIFRGYIMLLHELAKPGPAEPLVPALLACAPCALLLA